jgi:FixJ family two-component response regulator
MSEKSNQLIAIVDDDESVREATTSLLRSSGFKAVAFPSAEAYLASPFLTTTRCLLLDVAMPGMNGLELQRRLADEGHRIPIIFITAHFNQEIRAEAMRAGAVDVLPKPFGEEALLSAIRKALNNSSNN